MNGRPGLVIVIARILFSQLNRSRIRAYCCSGRIVIDFNGAITANIYGIPNNLRAELKGPGNGAAIASDGNR